MINRGPNFQQTPLNMVGSSTFGRYPKISIEKTYNMFQSDTALVPYSGYKIAVSSSRLLDANEGRGIFSSIKFGRLVVVQGSDVFLVNINYSQSLDEVTSSQVVKIGALQSQTGVVYISENNKPQIGISDGTNFYLYDPTLTPSFKVIPLNFKAGYLSFHNSRFILAASNDTAIVLGVVAENSWRLSDPNNGEVWPSTARYVGLLQTKADNVQAVVRLPSKGNMILVMGTNVTEPWFDVGGQLFPYQRNAQMNIDYGCLNPATVAYMDEFVVWLAINESSGPVIMASSGGDPKKITTDGIDYLFSTLENPQDAQGFLYRQDGHLFYHINFYSDNISLFYDFNTGKIYNACDVNMNYFIASQVAFFRNQYYFVTKNNGNIFALDTTITSYEDVSNNGTVSISQIPRIRICSNIRQMSQEYSIINDIGFTIESGDTPYYQQAGNESNLSLAVPRVDLSLSIDGGATFGQSWGQTLPSIGKRKNKLAYWGLGAANDAVMQFRFWSYGRIVVLDGECNCRI